ncbi:uncharacterized protein LOC114571127 [Perca flavescens]|uniref:uncharacterized protein LOC114571127 n=1 Tax=Perca flavescens TaxID=8167 RepID=UPI00106E4C02|nr:uncharacterized protein LOC114571127 [Perca flavescens]
MRHSAMHHQRQKRGSYIQYICVMTNSDKWCSSWKCAIANTGSDWGNVGCEPYDTMHLTITHRDLKSRLSVGRKQEGRCQEQKCNPIYVMLKDPKPEDAGTYVMGLYAEGKDPLGQFIIRVTDPWSNNTPSTSITAQVDAMNTGMGVLKDSKGPLVKYLNLEDFTIEERLEMETGFTPSGNTWLKMMKYTARTHKMSDCVICAKARPHLGTVPFPLSPVDDLIGYNCMLSLYSDVTMESDVCRTLSLLYPRVCAIQPPPGVVAYPRNYTCITQPDSSTMNVGHLPKKFCMYTYNTSSFVPNVTQSMFNNQSKGLADVWWMCGTQPRLRPSLPAKWGGTCA